ncbi:lysis inhibitor [Aeromonas phage Ahp1_CNU-2021]|nr:lysis inhibitor [Aeromonas phage Ahp1_CNU-2021]
MKTVSKELHTKILAKQVGRTALAKELKITESQARKLIEDVRAGKIKPVEPVVVKPVAVPQPVATTSRHEAQFKEVGAAVKKRDEEVISLYKTTSMTMEEIGKKVGIGRSTVGEILKRAGVPKRGPQTASVPKVKVTEVPSDSKEEVKWVMGPTFLNIYADGQTFTASKDHANFTAAAKLCMDGKIREALDKINVAKAVKSYSKGDIKIDGETVSYKGLVVDLGITKRIIAAMNEGKPFENLVNFLEKLMLNPSYRAVQELFGFLQHNDIELTPEGDFLAFKRVNTNYTDFYTGKMDNKPGAKVSMLRNTVNEDKNQTCSSGLHVAAKSYIPKYHGGQGKIVVCRVNPKDVVSVPTDYSNSKMRVCEYIVEKDVTATFSHYK